MPFETIDPILVDVAPFDNDGAEQFKRQRALLTKLLSVSSLDAQETEDLEGLQCFCDHIADQLHDVHGFDTLFTSTEVEA